MTPTRIQSENHPFDEIRIGNSASIARALSRDDIALFARRSLAT